MITIQQARALVLDAVSGPLPAESVPVSQAAGRVLAAEVRADGDLPPFDRVMMDGFAVRAAETADVPARLSVAGEVAAGDGRSQPLRAGEALAIMTGAPLPPGADAVVPVEWTTSADGQVLVDRPVRPGQHVAPRGQDVAAGAVVARAGDRATTLSLSLLVSTGVERLAVVRRPIVSLLTSGDELVAPGAPLRHGQIRESNGPALASLLAGAGAEIAALTVVRDRRAALDAALAAALQDSDVVVLTGGSSVGRYDFSAEAAEAAGCRRRFDRVSIKPGKPTLFFTRGDQLVFCLPGNPVAALMTARVLVCAALSALGGRPTSPWTERRLPLAGPVRRVAERDQLLPMRVQGGQLVFDGWHGSGDLACMARAEGFGFVARGEGSAPVGTPADWFALPAETAW